MDVFAAKRLHDFFNVELSVVSKYQHTGLRRVSLSLAATALRVIPAWFWFTASLYHYSSTITAPFPSPVVATIYKPNPPCFIVASLHFPSSPSFSPHPFSLLPRTHLPPPLFPIPIYMPIICPYSCYIGTYCTIGLYVCYTGVATRDDVMPIYCRAATQDAIIIVSSCYGATVSTTVGPTCNTTLKQYHASDIDAPQCLHWRWRKPQWH